MSDYTNNILALLKHQRDKGLAKYGVTLEENVTLSTQQRIEHAEEELIDALMYLEHLKAAAADELTANDYQRMAMRTAAGMDYSKAGENGLLLNGLMGLNGEAGECIDIMKKHIFQGHELDREHLIEELGDCAWYLAVSCEGLNVTLEEVLRGNVDKLMRRYPDGFDKERSIHREETEDAEKEIKNCSNCCYGDPETEYCQCDLCEERYGGAPTCWRALEKQEKTEPDELGPTAEEYEKPKTYEQDFLEMFPNVPRDSDGSLAVCRNDIYGLSECVGDCEKCWGEVKPNE